MLDNQRKRAMVSLATVLFFALAGQTFAADEMSQVDSSSYLWQRAPAANMHLGFPDNPSAPPDAQLVRNASAAAWNMTDQQAYVPLPSSGWAGLGILTVMICRKPILRLVS